MRKALGLAAAVLLLCLVGCGKRQGVDAAANSPLKDIPNDTGGYAKDLAEPPVERHTPAVEQDIQAGHGTNTSDPQRDPDEAEQAKKDQEKAKADPAEDPNKPATKDISGDSKWQTNPKPVAAFQTNKGVVYLELWPDVAPKHVANFEKLINKKFYDGIYVHRVEPGFVVQAGDPYTKVEGPAGPRVGTGGPGWTVPAEFSKKPHLRGTLSMARSQDVNSGGSQFFICLDRAVPLDGKYSVFGQVLGDGMDTVDKLKVGDKIQFAWMVKQ